MKIKRREARETAFALLFEWAFKPEETLDELIEQAGDSREIIVDPFAKRICQHTMDNISELDSLIETYSDKWKLNRLSKVTLSVLRMAFCELVKFSDIPAGATINEAVELVKTYGTEDEAAYVNGILGTYERRRSGAAKTEKATRFASFKSAEAEEAAVVTEENADYHEDDDIPDFGLSES